MGTQEKKKEEGERKETEKLNTERTGRRTRDQTERETGRRY